MHEVVVENTSHEGFFCDGQRINAATRSQLNHLEEICDPLSILLGHNKQKDKNIGFIDKLV